MAFTMTLVFSKPNHLRYLAVATVGSGETVQVAGATLLADASPGPIKNIMNIQTQGYGKIAANTNLDSAMARALLCSDNAAAAIGANIPTALMTTEQRNGTGTIVADAAFDASNPKVPWITLAAPAAGAASAYIDIYIPGAIGA